MKQCEYCGTELFNESEATIKRVNRRYHWDCYQTVRTIKKEEEPSKTGMEILKYLKVIGEDAPAGISDFLNKDTRSNPTVTRQLKRMLGLGLVERRKEKNLSYYSISREGLKKLKQVN